MNEKLLKQLQALQKPELPKHQKEALGAFQKKTLAGLVDWLKTQTYQDGEKTMRFIPTDVDPDLDVPDDVDPNWPPSDPRRRLPALSERLDGFLAALSSISNSDRKERSITWAKVSC